MPLVNVMVNARAYTIACDEGEEAHLKELAAHVDTKVRSLLESVGQAGEQRLFLMAALLIADDYFGAMGLLDRRAKELGEFERTRGEVGEQVAGTEHRAAQVLEEAARRVEDIAARLGHA
ncbi:MAG TPA: cell division protein ZapA [Rhizomicrobium sp.]|jgi:cell division protein ZapA